MSEYADADRIRRWSMRGRTGIMHPYLAVLLLVLVGIFLLVVLGVLFLAFLLAPVLVVGFVLIFGGLGATVMTRGIAQVASLSVLVVGIVLVMLGALGVVL